MCAGFLNVPLPQGDVCNSRLVNHIFVTEPIDAIFHLAAKTHVGEWQLDPDHVWLLSDLRTDVIFRLCHDQSRRSGPLPASSTSMWMEPEYCWKLPTGPHVSLGASSTSARMRCTGPARIRWPGGLLLGRLDDLGRSVTVRLFSLRRSLTRAVH